MLNRIGDKQHPCLTRLPVFTLLVSPRFIRTLTLWAMYKLLTNLLSRQSIPVPFRICINLVQLTRSDSFYQSVKQTQSSGSISKVRSDIILSNPIASLVPCPLLNPDWSSSSTSSISFQSFKVSLLLCAMIAAFCSLWLPLPGNHCNFCEIRVCVCVRACGVCVCVCGVWERERAKIRCIGCRFMHSDNASPILYIYFYGKFSLELCQVFRNAPVAKNVNAMFVRCFHDASLWIHKMCDFWESNVLVECKNSKWLPCEHFSFFGIFVNCSWVDTRWQ